MTVTLYHKPNCQTSRGVLKLLRERGVEPKIVPYLEKPPTRAKLGSLLARMKLTPRQFIRRKEPLFAELGLGDPAVTDDQLMDAMLAHPILIDRPIVEVGRKARLCRPPELALGLLPHADQAE